MPEDRRLAAIMLARRSLCEGGPARRSTSGGGFTDIVGYTALMGSDEDQVGYS